MTAPPSQPRVGVGALITDDQGRILLVKRRRNPEADHWGIPGGKVDFGERVADTCAREILEEVGLQIEVRDLVCLVDQIDAEAGTHWVSPVFRARILAGEAVNREPEAIAAIGWFEPGDLPTPLTLSTRHALNL